VDIMTVPRLVGPALLLSAAWTLPAWGQSGPPEVVQDPPPRAVAITGRYVVDLMGNVAGGDARGAREALGDGEAVKTGQGRFLARKVLAPPPGVEDQRDERWRWTIRPAFDLPLLNP
jgi:hypothetical protein